MKKSILVAIIVALIVTAAVVGYALGNTYIEKPPLQRPQGGMGGLNETAYMELFPNSTRNFYHADRDSFIHVKSEITLANADIASILIALYVSFYRTTKSEFTLSLIVVMAALLVYSITSNPLVPMAFGYHIYGFGIFTMIPDMCATAALGLLLYLSLK